MKKMMGAMTLFFMFASAPSFAAEVIDASGSGWCRSTGCNNVNDTLIRNHAASSNNPGEGREYRNWFAFEIPSQIITTAILSIWNNEQNFTSDNTAFYQLRAVSKLTFSDLNKGPELGGILLAEANGNASGYVDIILDSQAIALLNASSGRTFLFGGTVTGSGLGENSIFGYTGGRPVARLTVDNAGAVPEPSTWAMMILGFGLIGGAIRSAKRKQKLTFSYA